MYANETETKEKEKLPMIKKIYYNVSMKSDNRECPVPLYISLNNHIFYFISATDFSFSRTLILVPCFLPLGNSLDQLTGQRDRNAVKIKYNKKFMIV